MKQETERRARVRLRWVCLQHLLGLSQICMLRVVAAHALSQQNQVMKPLIRRVAGVSTH